MLKYCIGLFSLALVVSSCLKSNDNDDYSGCPYKENKIDVPASEQLALATFLDTSNIEAVKDTSGIYYQIITPGTGTDSVGLCSVIRIQYTGTLTTGAEFDKQSQIDFILGDRLIEGWRKGVPKIKRGGQIKLYIPPKLGYGAQPVYDQNNKLVIPANSILIFDIKLIDYTASN